RSPTQSRQFVPVAANARAHALSLARALRQERWPARRRRALHPPTLILSSLVCLSTPRTFTSASHDHSRISFHHVRISFHSSNASCRLFRVSSASFVSSFASWRCFSAMRNWRFESSNLASASRTASERMWSQKASSGASAGTGGGAGVGGGATRGGGAGTALSATGGAAGPGLTSSRA
ncbi:hypothetical protein C8J57DRAFT_1327012, partial [Mycena rebaudengoi]